MIDKLMGVSEVCKALCLSRTTLWRMVKDNKFPQPIRVSDRKRVWPADEVEAYLNTRNAERTA